MQPQVRSYYADLADAYQEEGNHCADFCTCSIACTTSVPATTSTCAWQRFPFLLLGPNYPFAAARQKIVDPLPRRQKIPVLDLAPVLEPHLAEGLVVNGFDAHPNERAHQLAAEAMERELLPDLMKKP